MGIPFIDIHTHQTVFSEEIIPIQSYFLQDVKFQHLSSPFTAGIHPWHAEYFQVGQINNMLNDLKDQKQCIAVGESGFDKKSEIDFNKQKEAFEIQLTFAEDHNMPMIIHNVGAWNEIIDYKKCSDIPFILHHYRGNHEITKQLLRLDCYFSFGNYLLQGNSSTKEILRKIPIERLFFETDDSQTDLKSIYKSAAEILIIPVDDLKEQIFSNFNQLFAKENH